MVYIFSFMRVEKQEHKHVTDFPHVFAHAHDTELSHSKSMRVQ